MIKITVIFSLLVTILPSYSQKVLANESLNTEGNEITIPEEVTEVSEIVNSISDQSEGDGVIISEEIRLLLEQQITTEVQEIEADVQEVEAEIVRLEQLELTNPSYVQPDRVATEALNLTDSKIVRIYQTNLTKANSIKASYNKVLKEQGLAVANVYRLSIFYTLVRSNGPWDLKRSLGTTTKYRFKNVLKTGEYIGNHHYGYMGKAIGFSNLVLNSAAGMYQVKSGTSDWKYISSYFDDPADQTAITNGHTDYSNGFRFNIVVAGTGQIEYQ